jgi:prepilin-type N-terminal cleavage/methylation domain-containing protein
MNAVDHISQSHRWNKHLNRRSEARPLASRRTAAGFTLIELLGGIAIIALLAAEPE